MLGQLGFTLPLLIILVLEVITGFLLLCPKPLNQPAVALARASHTQVGSTIFYTLAGVLLLLLASPLYDGIQLYYLTRDKSDAAAGLESSEHEARTLLSFLLTSTTVALQFFLRKLGAVVGLCDRMAVSEAALLKQVKGLQSEYTRMADTSAAAAGGAAAPSAEAGAGAGDTAEAMELRRVVADLERTTGELETRLEKAVKAQQQAESNLAALKTQSRGLENEYDRLLAEHDELRRQLQRAGLATGGAVDGRFAKKDS